MKCYLFVVLLSIYSNVFGQEKFRIKEVETGNGKTIYYMVNEKGKSIKELDSTKYTISMNADDYLYFAIFHIKGEKGWSAIDSNENVLFEVYNTSFGEPSPDEIIEKKIRIVDENDKIGFADYKGKIIIKPQFEIASSFHKGKAIIGQSCDKIPWDKHVDENGCHHYSVVCDKQGYIDESGRIILLGDYTFEEIQKKIHWKRPD
ncbi:WG repeat-containing protein [Flavobacterium aestivum]|uniref:WG repeat-containing protein n=1 Tax=Flavobacterium aestivum TaxID=3003257 RepID=UPI0022865501|nr:WG repeat-containing protein [Flavobacterium aestivum]